MYPQTPANTHRHKQGPTDTNKAPTDTQINTQPYKHKQTQKQASKDTQTNSHTNTQTDRQTHSHPQTDYKSMTVRSISVCIQDNYDILCAVPLLQKNGTF